jgi:hypothetical protein
MGNRVLHCAAIIGSQRPVRWLRLIGCLVLAGCTAAAGNSDSNSNQDRHSGFYTGLSGGLSDTMGH